METTNELAVWAYSNTGTLAHAMLKTAADGRLVAACRSNITRNPDARLHAAEDISGRLCTSCETRWNDHLARVERSMQPIQPCESFEVYGAAPEQTVDHTPMTRPARPQRPAYKTIVKAEITWTLQSRKDTTDAWSYVSDHASEEAATRRAQAFLIEGSRRHFRVIEHRTEVRATDPIEPPKDTEQAGDRYVVREVGVGYFAVFDTEASRNVTSGCSRYGAQYIRDGLNDGSMVLDPTGTVVSAPEKTKDN
ncbi:hypothetical protein ACFC1T_27810 [Kitasatospora sp. NPDC056076]|uniref:hypothetical protein n=1 Tax=Kitasatospora sp. NPDC056076 TaxID=3345703 RepID=UPI0035DB2B72